MNPRLALALITITLAPSLGAQGYRLRLDSRMQGVSWRGIERDSIPRAEALPGDNGGFLTPDGYRATCEEDWCHFLRAGAALRGVPWVTVADLTAWGFGVTGLRLRLNARHATDLGDVAQWPGTEPDLQLIEGYLEYNRLQFALQAGRQFLTSRLGGYGLDGIRASWRPTSHGLEVAAYGGWGLARGSLLPVTSPEVNPLDDFQPRDRQLAVGAEAGWTRGWADVRLEYRREVDPAVDYFVSERAAASVALRPLSRLSLTTGAVYDLAMGNWGSADATITYMAPIATLSGGARRYMPYFDLWTIWGAFSPVAFHAWHGAITTRPVHGVTVHARGERYQFDETETASGLVQVEDRGWRVEGGATWEPRAGWSVAVGHQAEFGPGASSLGYDARVTWRPSERFTAAAHAATLRRPLELRFSDATLAVYGGDIDWRPSPHWRLGIGIARVEEQRDRPDAAALDWNQWRLSARITVLRGTDVDRPVLPRARRTGVLP
jgi:hypothetical protein